jgi:serine/threonine protein kinase
MGAIYVGKKIGPGGFEKEVVLKQLLPEFTSRPEFRDLFFREAKISATLDHQNIVRTFDLVNSNDRLFIVMEYVRGADLRTIAWRARRRKPLSAQAILHVAIEILNGLAYAHTKRSPAGDPLGIIHRDLSPSNILCSGEGEVKLSDFGIAKAVTYSSVFYRVRGKVGYMSPEMARNQPIDARSDLFSLGVSIYETLIGERIYTGDLNTPPDKIYAQKVPRLEAKCSGLPAHWPLIGTRASPTRKLSPRRYGKWPSITGCSTRRPNWRPSCARSWGPIQSTGCPTSATRPRCAMRAPGRPQTRGRARKWIPWSSPAQPA